MTKLDPITALLIALLSFPVCRAGADDATLDERAEWRNRDIEISVDTPDSAWSIRIDKIYVAGSEIWSIARLQRAPGIAAQVVSTVRDRGTLKAPDTPIRHFVLGKTWKWENDADDVSFINDVSAIGEELRSAQLLWARESSSADK